MAKTRKMKPRGGKMSMSSLTNLRSNSNSNSKSSTNKYSPANLVLMFMRMLNTVKLYHWKTSSYAQHKATDELYSNLNSSIDSFVEIMLGKDGSRVNLTNVKSIQLHDYNDLSGFKQEVDMYKEYLKNLNKEGTDLLNVRDEILGHLNQFTYLLTFK
jgi:DNA-binding ferritin-like protein